MLKTNIIMAFIDISWSLPFDGTMKYLNCHWFSGYITKHKFATINGIETIVREKERFVFHMNVCVIHENELLIDPKYSFFFWQSLFL